MTANLLFATDEETAGRAGDVSKRDPSGWHSDLLAKLLNWFGIEFHLVDGNTGEPLHCAFDQTARDWSVLGQLCRAVATRAKAEIIEEEGPLTVMAVPIREVGEQSVVAIGTFVTSPCVSQAQLAQAAEMLGLEPADAANWIGRQTVWTVDALARMGQMAGERLMADPRLTSLEREIKDLSLHLSTTYEEISLLYRLTQNLKLSSKDEDLGSLALAWLADALPVESLAIQFTRPQSGSICRDADTQPVLLTHGPCPLDNQEFTRLIELVGAKSGQRPLIVN